MTFKIAFGVKTTRTVEIDVNAPDAGAFQARLLAADGSVISLLTSATPAFEFTGIPAGEFTAEMSRLDATGAVIAGSVGSIPVSAVVPAPATKSVDVPGELSATVTVE